jgi:hypothetical protein
MAAGADGPGFVLEEFFEGRVAGYGFQETVFGRVARRFTVDAVGQWEPRSKQLKLDERYRFEDGVEDLIEWRITPTGDGRYVGDEPKLAGRAEGDVEGAVLRWRYRRPPPDGGPALDVDDAFTSPSPGVVLVRGSVGRFRLPLARLFVCYVK